MHKSLPPRSVGQPDVELLGEYKKQENQLLEFMFR